MQVNYGVYNAVAPTLSTGQIGQIQLDVNGNTKVVVQGTIPTSLSTLPALVAGSAIVGQVGIDQTTPGTTNKVSIGTDGTVGITGSVAVTGTFWQATQPVSGTFWQTTQPVSVAATLVTDDLASSTTASTVPSNAMFVGNRAATANPTAVTDGQLVGAMVDKLGRRAVVLNHVRDMVVTSATTITNTITATSVLAAQGSNVFGDITSLTITNASATATTATLSDGTKSYIYAIASNGGITLQFTTPLPATSSNTAWTVALGVNTVTMYVNIVAVKNL